MTSAPGPQAPSPKWLAARILVTAGVMSALFAGIAWKAFTVQIRDHDKMRALGEAQYLHRVELPAPRGSIVDRNGMDLAISVEVQSVFANPREVEDPRGAAAALAGVLNLPVAQLEDKLSSGKRFAWLARRVRGEQAIKVRDLKLPGIGLSPEAQRFYPGGALAGPLLGVAGLDGKGLEGIEHSQDEHLAGDKAHMPVLRDARGGLLLSGWDEADAHAVAGRTVMLTVDRYIQHVAERALANGMEANKAKAGVVVVLDARSGEVLAMASAPTFDPNSTGHRGDARNRPVTDTYEPGSGMKLFVVAAALEAGLITPGDLFHIEGGRLQIGRKTIKDVHPPDKQMLTVSEIIQHSSNVGAVKIIRKLGKDAMVKALLAYGFAAKTGIELPGEQMGTIRSQARWGEVELATKSFGYGLRATPLQMAAALGAIANRGLWSAPRIVKEVRSGDGKLFAGEPPVRRQVMSPEHADAMLAMMETVMQKGGTGDKLKVPGYRVAGKTGTAHKVDPATKKYSADRYISSFIGVVPANDPRLVVVVFIDEPNAGKHYGGVVAGPVFVELVTEALKYLGVPATEPFVPAKPVKALAKEMAVADSEAAPPPEDETTPLAVAFELPGAPPAGPGEAIVVIPDFTGLSVAQAVAAARSAGVRVELTGSGKAVEQYPPPGRAMKSITCRITFDPG